MVTPGPENAMGLPAAVCFDYRGTLIDHRTDEPIPEMMDLLDRLSRDGIPLAVASRFPEDLLKERLGRLTAYFGDNVYSSSRRDKLACIRQFAAAHGIADLSAICFVDDKPANLLPVARESNVRVVGFKGSNKYPDTAEACEAAGIAFAESAGQLRQILFEGA